MGDKSPYYLLCLMLFEWFKPGSCRFNQPHTAAAQCSVVLCIGGGSCGVGVEGAFQKEKKNGSGDGRENVFKRSQKTGRLVSSSNHAVI